MDQSYDTAYRPCSVDEWVHGRMGDDENRLNILGEISDVILLPSFPLSVLLIIQYFLIWILLTKSLYAHLAALASTIFR